MTNEELVADIVDKVKKAQEQFGFDLIFGAFHYPPGQKGQKACCCPLVALAVYAGAVTPDHEDAAHLAIEWAKKTFGEKWYSGFWLGVDAREEEWLPDDCFDGYKVGVAVGRALESCESK